MLYRAAEQDPASFGDREAIGIFLDSELSMITITCFPSQGMGCESTHDDRRKSSVD